VCICHLLWLLLLLLLSAGFEWGVCERLVVLVIMVVMVVVSIARVVCVLVVHNDTLSRVCPPNPVCMQVCVHQVRARTTEALE
jgi:hypothetical protein